MTTASSSLAIFLGDVWVLSHRPHDPTMYSTLRLRLSIPAYGLGQAIRFRAFGSSSFLVERVDFSQHAHQIRWSHGSLVTSRKYKSLVVTMALKFRASCVKGSGIRFARESGPNGAFKKPSPRTSGTLNPKPSGKTGEGQLCVRPPYGKTPSSSTSRFPFLRRLKAWGSKRLLRFRV